MQKQDGESISTRQEHTLKYVLTRYAQTIVRCQDSGAILIGCSGRERGKLDARLLEATSGL